MARRRLLAVAVAVAVLGLLSAEGWAARGAAIIRGVDCTATRSHVAGSNAARTALTVQNVGSNNLYLGGQAGQPVTTGSNQWTLHVGSTLEFGGPHGGDPTTALECITDTGSVRLQIIEEF